VGFSSGGGGPPPAAAGEAPSNLCEQALEQAQRGGLIVDRRNPQRVTVRRGLWAELPEQAKTALTMCFEATRPAAAAGRPVEIVEVD
jgi:hypothetical protein